MQITVLHFVPCDVKRLLPRRVARCRDLRQVICSGEALSLELQAEFLRRHSAQLAQSYGPTEAAIDVLAYELCISATARSSVPIGRPIWNTQLCILDAELNPVPLGVVGELYIGGAGLARGYHGRPGLTAERFVPNPFARTPGERLYRTGDLARWRPDGVIDYVGRIDHQVKIRGFRIELGEIEAKLLVHEDVREAVVVAREGASGKQLIGYVVAGDGEPEGASAGSPATSTLVERLKEHLRAALPDYMVPARLVMLERLPLTPNGKLDRKALPEPDFTGVDYVAPRSEIESKLAAIWQEVLGVEQVGVTDNFFELGGDSIQSLQIIAKARKEGLKLTPKQLFEKQTIGELALVTQVLADKGEASQADAIVTGPMRLTPIQLWFFDAAIPERHHWNQSILLHPREAFAPDALEQALRAVVTHHDALRLRYRQDDAGAWTASHASVNEEKARWAEEPLLWVREAQVSLSSRIAL